MKAKFIILLILSLTNIAFSKEVRSVKLASKPAKIKSAPQRYSRIMCNQKSIPMKVEQSLNGQLLTVSFTAEQKIENFSLKNVRGIDGATVSKFQELINQKLNRGEVIESGVELGNFSGLVYVVFDISVTVNGVSSDHSIPVAVGALSASQIKERSKNIKEIKNMSQQKNGTTSITAPPKKIHEMQLE
ncbi:MAG: hypothetical protein PHY93_10375 [Bacteriovorax sp.]|nr:hypothetical protein [Bacteriovorax sp.]